MIGVPSYGPLPVATFRAKVGVPECEPFRSSLVSVALNTFNRKHLSWLPILLPHASTCGAGIWDANAVSFIPTRLPVFLVGPFQAIIQKT
jgi:hypothetical protein